MKTALSIFLSLSLSFQSLHVKVEDLWSVEELVEHVQMHAEKYNDSLTDFIIMHYGSLKADHYDTHSEHDELPFNHKSCSIGVSVFLVDHQEIPGLRVGFTTPRTHTFFYASTYCSLELADIFQPPQHA